LIARDSLLEIALALDNPDIASKTEALRTLRLGQKIGI
jgi:hypothetical protein